MWNKIKLAVILLLAFPSFVNAQTLIAEALYLTTGPCILFSGSGSPEGSKSGSTCDIYINTSNGEMYRKASGTNTTTGWTLVSLPSSMVSNSVLVSNGTTASWSATPTVTSLTTATISASSNLTLSPTGDIITNPGGGDILPTANYLTNIGANDKKYLTLYASELRIDTLVAQQVMATIGGRVVVAPTNILAADLSNVATSITVKYNNFTSGDRIVMESSGKLEFMAVTSSASGSSGAYVYSVTRDLDGSGANTWYAGDAILDTGTTGNGYIDLYSSAALIPGSTVGPTIVGNVRTGTTFSNIAPRWAIGNLNGLYGYSATTYGAAFGDPSASNIVIDSTNGIRIRYGTTNKITADASGNLSLVGNLVVSSSGVISSGATAFGTGTGFWLSYNGGAPQFRIGTASGNRAEWTGSNFNIYGTEYELSDSYGLRFNDATEGDFSNIVSWASKGEIGANSARIWMCAAYTTSCDGFHLNIYAAGNLQVMNGSTSKLGIDNSSIEAYVDLYATESFHVSNVLYMTDPGSTTSDDYPMVWSSGNERLYYKTNGWNGTGGCSGVSDIDVHRGIVVGISCIATELAPSSLEKRISSLENEVSELKILIARLLNERK